MADVDKMAAFDVNVVTGDGAHTIKCNPSWTLGDLKVALEAKTGMPAQDQKMSVKAMNLSFYRGSLKPLLGGGSAITLENKLGGPGPAVSEDALRRTGQSVLESKNMAMPSGASYEVLPSNRNKMQTTGGSFALSNGSMMPGSSCGALPSSQNKMQTTGGSFALSNGSMMPSSYGSMMPSSSCGGLPSSQYKLDSTCGSLISRASRKSYGSAASLRSEIIEATKEDFSKPDKVSQLQAYYARLEAKKQRERKKAFDRPVHLRPNPANILDAGCAPNYLTQQMRSLQLPVQMATNPKWSTDLKNINDKIGQRLEWERKVAAAMTGSMIPELKHMPPKTYIEHPTGPCFKPGEAHLARC